MRSVPLVLLLVLCALSFSHAYHPGRSFMNGLPTDISETLEGIFSRASEWRANGRRLSHASQSAHHARMRQIRSDYDDKRHRRDPTPFVIPAGADTIAPSYVMDTARNYSLRQSSGTATAPPVQYSRNPDPNPFVIPAGATTIKVGRTWPQSEGNPETPYGLIAEQGFRTFERIFNSGGGLFLNASQAFLDFVTYNDGGDCNLMLILYERLITIDGVTFLQTAIHYACSFIALVAEAYEIPLINTCDFTLPILMSTHPSYMYLQWTWSFTSNYFTAGDAIVEPLSRAGARTIVTFEVPEAPFFADQAEVSAKTHNMTVLMPKTVFSIAAARASYDDIDNTDGCAYFADFVDSVIELDPDVLYGSALTETEVLLTCFYRKLYRPRGLAVFVGYPTFGSPTFWKTQGIFSNNPWVDNGTFADPFIPAPAVQTFVTVFDQIWNTNETSLGYQASHGAGTGIGLYAIQQAQSTDPSDIATILNSINMETVVGPITLINGTRQYYRPYYGQQVVNLNNSINIVYPPTYEDVKPAIYPFNMTYPQEFRDSLKKPHAKLSKDAKLGLGIGIGGVFGILLLIGIILLVLHFNFHVLWVKKSDIGSTDNWDNASTERKNKSVWACLRC